MYGKCNRELDIYYVKRDILNVVQKSKIKVVRSQMFVNVQAEGVGNMSNGRVRVSDVK